MPASALPREDSTILETRHLTRQVDSRFLVNDVSVEIRRGEILAVVGPSGSGKSSFLRLLNRLDEPSSGAIWLEGTDYKLLSPRELRRQVGMVTQRAFLFPGSVAANIRYGPEQRGQTLSQDAVEQLLAKVGLPGCGPRDIAHLSGGEAQRVSLARALANSPSVLLLDEPTSALDDDAKLGIETLIRGIMGSAGLTCVMVTHDISQARRLAGRAMLLEAGRATRIGPVQETLRA